MNLDLEKQTISQEELTEIKLSRGQWQKKNTEKEVFFKEVINVGRVIMAYNEDHELGPIGVLDIDEKIIYRLGQWGGKYGPQTPPTIPFEIRKFRRRAS